MNGPGINSAVTFAFDAADGHIDTPWQNYLDSFAQGCLVSAITGPIGNKLGNCNSAALRFAGNFGQQMASSTLSGIMNGELSLESLGKNAVRELIGTVLGNSVLSSNKWKSGSNKKVHIQKNFYDAENLRYGIEEDGKQNNFVTNGWSVFTELDAEWKTTKRLVRGYGIVASEELGECINADETGVNSYHYYHLNEHGDVEYITDNDSKVANAYTYDAFGNITKSDELVKNRYTYNGEQYDKTTEQYYLRARFYNPLIGRFTQEDVYRGDGLNLYAYCGANPVMYVDPSGYKKKKCKVNPNEQVNSSDTILFGQKRIADTFRKNSGAPEYIEGRKLSDVADDIRSRKLSPDQFEVKYFIDPKTGKKNC